MNTTTPSTVYPYLDCCPDTRRCSPGYCVNEHTSICYYCMDRGATSTYAQTPDGPLCATCIEEQTGDSSHQTYTKAQVNALVAAVANSHPTVEPTVLQFRLETIRQLLTLPTSD